MLRLDEALDGAEMPGLDFVDLDEALKVLAKVDPRKSQVVELRFFGGLNLEEMAEVLKVSSRNHRPRGTVRVTADTDHHSALRCPFEPRTFF